MGVAVAKYCHSVFHTETLMIFVKYRCGHCILLFNSLQWLSIVLKMNNTIKLLLYVSCCAKGSTRIILSHPPPSPAAATLMEKSYDGPHFVDEETGRSGFVKATELVSDKARILMSASLSSPTQQALHSG